MLLLVSAEHLVCTVMHCLFSFHFHFQSVSDEFPELLVLMINDAIQIFLLDGENVIG